MASTQELEKERGTMFDLKGYERHVCLVLVAFAVTACAVFYLCANPIGGGEDVLSRWRLRNFQPKPTELSQVLENASTEERTVVITTFNEAWSAPNSTLDLFLESFRIGEQTQGFLKHLVIVAFDRKALDRCRSVHPHCYLLTITNSTTDFSGEKKFMTQDYLKLVWEKVNVMLKVLKLGYSFVFTDGDIMWLRNPFPHFNTTDDITASCDRFNGNNHDRSNPANTGFVYARSNPRTIRFYEYWYEARTKYPGTHDQQAFDRIKRDKRVDRMGLRMRFLDTAFFGGFCQVSKDLNKVCTMHANCCVGLDRKVHDLGVVLDYWRNYTKLTSKERSAGVVSWRLPVKCGM